MNFNSKINPTYHIYPEFAKDPNLRLNILQQITQQQFDENSIQNTNVSLFQNLIIIVPNASINVSEFIVESGLQSKLNSTNCSDNSN